MALPKKRSRLISIDGTQYRWLVTFLNGVLHLTIETENDVGQLLQAVFEPHDGYSRSHNGWTRQSQRREIAPSTVRRIVAHAKSNGWMPAQKSSKPFRIWAWDADQIAPCPNDLPEDQVPIRDIAIEQVCDLQFDLSLDPAWRKRLFDAPVGEHFPLAADYFGLSEKSREYNLRFSAFNEGAADDWGGFVVFGIASVEFPDVIAYTTNNSSIVDW